MKKLIIHKESPCVQPIVKLIRSQTRRSLVLWTQDCAKPILAMFEERYPHDPRPREALEASISWARGDIKMSIAKKAALAAHNAATEVESDATACAAARAMGHVVGTVHTEKHAINVVLYGITAFLHADPQAEAEQLIGKKIDWFMERLQYWQEKEKELEGPWATFLSEKSRQEK